MLRSGGPGIFPPNAREGDADEQPRGGGGDGRHRGDRRCEGPLVDGSPPAWLQRQVRWLQGPEARAGTLAAPLPPARAGRGPCGSQDILVQCVLCSTSGEGPSAASPGNPKASRSPCHVPLSCVPGLVPAPRKPTRNAIIVVVTLVSPKRKPAPRDGMTQPRSHDASGRAGTGTPGSWVHSLPHAPGCCPSLPFPPPHTHIFLSYSQQVGSVRQDRNLSTLRALIHGAPPILRNSPWGLLNMLLGTILGSGGEGWGCTLWSLTHTDCP